MTAPHTRTALIGFVLFAAATTVGATAQRRHDAGFSTVDEHEGVMHFPTIWRCSSGLTI